MGVARRPYAFVRCRHEAPALRKVRPRHWATCHLHEGGARDPLAQTAGVSRNRAGEDSPLMMRKPDKLEPNRRFRKTQ
jgi:hypothetical protein